MNIFPQTKSEMSNFCCFSPKKLLKMYYATKVKNASVRFLICMSSMCVQLFTAVEVAVLKLYVPKSNMAAISMETSPRGKFLF